MYYTVRIFLMRIMQICNIRKLIFAESNSHLFNKVNSIIKLLQIFVSLKLLSAENISLKYLYQKITEPRKS